jgi:hypothetical protein
LLALPAAAGLRGIALSLARLRLKWIPYYLTFILFNYVAMFQEMGSALRRSSPSQDPSDRSLDS